MFKKVVVLLIVLVSISFSQPLGNEVLILQSGDDNNGSITQVGGENEADIQQFSVNAINEGIIEQYGSLNEAYIFQNQTGSGTDPNFAKILQDGLSNNATITQNTSTIDESGDYNSSTVTQTGDNNVDNVTQN